MIIPSYFESVLLITLALPLDLEVRYARLGRVAIDYHVLAKSSDLEIILKL